MSEPLEVQPLEAPPDAIVTVPGSKSITNRALVCAALADGTSTIENVLRADDTEAMIDCLRALGVLIDVAGTTVEVSGPPSWPPTANLDARLSGTTSRFLLPVLTLGAGRYRLDGAPSLQRRPIFDLVRALRDLGAVVEGDRLPLTVGGPVRGGRVSVLGASSSQFLSGLLLAGPAMEAGLTVELVPPLVSQFYVEMTIKVMERFGVSVERDGFEHRVPTDRYVATDFAVEGDASAASYFFAAAAMTGGRVTVEGLGAGSWQRDIEFVRVLQEMGAEVVWQDDAITVTGPERLHGGTFDLTELSDTAQTLAVVAGVAEGDTEVSGIGFIRGKESDRVGDTVRELQRCGIEAEELADGIRIAGRGPHAVRPATIETYDDHRMAMSFALLGLVAPGIRIADPGVVGKTFPGFWDALARLRR
jgi:3-phosphoshikimate 1-carboxyvinyltransferase